MSKPLNARLYRALKAEFGDVDVLKEGEPFRATFRRDAINPRVVRMGNVEWGETYAVCCPCCGDKYNRLNISHASLTRKTFKSSSGAAPETKLIRLWHCFNESCERKEGSDLPERLLGLMERTRNLRQEAKSQIISADTGPPPDIDLPPGSVPVGSLPDDHLCLHYLRDTRGFKLSDMTKLGFRWDQYPDHLMLNNRIVCPLFARTDDGDLACKGWQARFLADDGREDIDKSAGEAKWYTKNGTKKASYLYNHHNVEGSCVAAVSEGPFDIAGGVGPEAGIATWGKSVSSRQKRILLRDWSGRESSLLVLAFDGDAYVIAAGLTEEQRKTREHEIEELRSLERAARTAWSHVVRLKFDPEYDPGKTPRSALWNEVYRLLRRDNRSDFVPLVSARVKVTELKGNHDGRPYFLPD